MHSVGFAPREQLAGGFVESITREGYQISHDISAYSLAALAKAALPMMENSNGSILTLTYNAATQVVPNYNVMGLAKASLESCVRFLAADLGPKGIRVNAISAGAVKTLAAAGIGGFRKMLNYAEKASPLRAPSRLMKSAIPLHSCVRISRAALRAKRRLSTPVPRYHGTPVFMVEFDED